jgi:C4-dicarboxylate-specific signal transduction histidine kinase
MIFAADQSAFDALHPFSFTTDECGAILAVGRSMAKLCPRVSVGESISKHFDILQPVGISAEALPQGLVGELVILQCKTNSNAQFRGHIVDMNLRPVAYLFFLKPLITSLSDISRLGLTISDFEPSDPIFDFLMYMQGQLTSQQKLREAKSVLKWENKVSNLLLSIALSTEESSSEQEAYQTTIRSVCSALEWEFGHVLIRSENDKDRLISAQVCADRAPAMFSDFERVSLTHRFARGEELPGHVWEKQDVVLIKEMQRHLASPRLRAVQHLPNLTGIGLPVFVNNEVVAILEFFTVRDIPDSESMRRFFGLLSAQLEGTIARQRAERAARQHLAELANASKMATLGEMAAGVAHEINNPLHTLTLTTHLLKKLLERNQLSPELLTGQLNRIESSINRMATIVSALKSFSRDSSKDAFESTSLKSLIQETLELSNATLNGRNMTLSTSEIPDTWVAECRASQISQVILNLLNNAFDAISGQPEPWIRVEVSDEGDYFQIAVSDSGAKIPDDVAKKIMTPFFTTKPPGKGTGLGLSVSSTILSDHGGGLSLDRHSQNTRFVMSLPKHRASSLPHKQTSTNAGLSAR